MESFVGGVVAGRKFGMCFGGFGVYGVIGVFFFRNMFGKDVFMYGLGVK